jgi:hypothetical protein
VAGVRRLEGCFLPLPQLGLEAGFVMLLASPLEGREGRQMKRQFVCALVIASAVVGCAQQTKTVWLRNDGRMAANDPVMSRQFEVDRAVCSGDTGKAGLVALNPIQATDGGGYNRAAGAERGALAGDVMRGCMAQKGYMLVREDEVQAKAAEYAAAAAQQAGQEAAAKQPPPSSSKRAASAQ